jgi:serine/threonine protein kinase
MEEESTGTELVMAATAPAPSPQQKQAAPAAAPVTRLGSILTGKYRIDALLGQGGCGRVYKATHLLLQGTVAIKFLLPAYASHEVLRERFSREARLLAKLCHPGIAAAHDYGEDNGELYLIMEYVAGRQLGLLLVDHQETGISIPRVVSISEQILDVLAAAHACGITHRDIKPSNIMLYQDDGGTERLKLLDFGLAFIAGRTVKPRLTGNGQVVGTVLYMAPEQCRGHVVGPPADIYSLGVVLYQMLTGRLPFTG